MNILAVEHPPIGSFIVIKFTFDELKHTVACLGGMSNEEIKLELVTHHDATPDDAQRICDAGDNIYYELKPITESNE